jgi:hypothetical protein
VGIGTVKYINLISSYLSLTIDLASKILSQIIVSTDLVPRDD